jgi:sugar phosphate isomerase/epimerase
MTAARLGLTLEVRHLAFRQLPGWLDEAEALGLDFAELPLAELPVLRGAKVIAGQLADLKSLCAGRALAYSVHGHLGINLMEEPFRIGLHLDVLKANIAVAAELGARHLVIHGGLVPVAQASAIEAAYARQRDHLRAMGDLARDHQVTLCVENLFCFDGKRHTALPGRLARELAAVAHPHVAATFDLSHGWLHCAAEGADFLTEAAALAPFARHLHLHDSFGRPDDFWTYTATEALAFGIGDLHLPMGWGSVPWDALAENCRWPAAVMGDLEIEPRHREVHVETVAYGRSWLSRLIRT